MAREVKLSDVSALEAFQESLFRSIQSSHLNFLLGAGASCPGVAIAGDVEEQILKLLRAGDDDKADRQTLQFLKSFKAPMSELLKDNLSANVAESVKQYTDLLQCLDGILTRRKNNLVPRQATIFTTNYDLFIERASEQCPSIILNDGFNRVPSIRNLHKFAPERLFDSTHHTGNYYDYKAELPSINLIKLHGSMSWANEGQDVVYRVMDFDELGKVKDANADAVSTYLRKLAIVLPTQRKFEQTLIERIYYDLLRIFANAMERENTLLIAFGFSFRDEHLFEIVKRALRNPTLYLIACCYLPNEVDALRQKFVSYNNLTLLVPDKAGDLTFHRLTSLIATVVQPKSASA